MANLHLRVLAILTFLGHLASASFSNEGREFYVGFMENQAGDGRDMYLYMTTGSNIPAEVTVTAPKQDANFRATVTVSRGQSARVAIPANYRASGSKKESKGVHVRSTQPIALYGLNQERGSGDAFTALPIEVLGTKYAAITWRSQGQILVVATQDATTVTVSLPGTAQTVTYNGRSYSGYDKIEVPLEKHQTMQLQGEELTATMVESTSKIAVFSGSKYIQIDGVSSDHLVQQLPPSNAWGTEFYVAAPPNSRKYKMKITSEKNGQVTISGEGAATNVAKHYSFVRDYDSGVHRRVSSTTPIQIAIFSQSTDSVSNMTDASFAIVPPVQQYRSRYTFATVGQNAAEISSHATVYVETNKTDTLMFDGQSMNSMSFTQMPGNSISMGIMPLSPGAHEIYSTDPLANLYILVTGFHGSPNGNYYVSYPAGMNVANINNPGCILSVSVAGDQIDNDCDGRVDEEALNNRDDDGDGVTDEDLALPPRANGNWGEWGSWQGCSVTCETGTRTRIRECNNPAPTNGGLPCPTDINGATDTEPCSLQRCPECEDTDDCSSKPNTICSDNKYCECASGYKDVSGLGQCVQLKINDPCRVSAECSAVMPNSRCFEAQCACSVGFKSRTDNTGCQQLLVGDACTSTAQCDVVMDNVMCGNDYTCHCNLGYIAVTGRTQCRLRVVGDSCSTNEDCSSAVTGTTCSPSLKKCTCANGYLPSADGTSCVARSMRDLCLSAEDCSAITPAGTAECRSDTDGQRRCFCMDIYREYNSSHCKPANIGDSCEIRSSASMCTAAIAQSECVNSRCACKMGYLASTDSLSCVRRTSGSACANTTDCSAAFAHSICSQGRCVCEQGYKYNPSENTCSKRTLGDPCSIEQDCSTIVADSTCTSGRCTCVNGYREENKQTCRARQIGDDCTDKNDCKAVTAGACITQGQGSKCGCPVGSYHQPYNKYSCIQRQIGDKNCDLVTDCSSVIEHSTCYDSACTCITGYRPTLDGKGCRNTLENWEIALIAAAGAFVLFALLCFLLGWCGRKRLRRRHSMKQFTGAWHSSIEDLRVSSAASDSTFNKEELKSWPADGMTEHERVETTQANPVYESSEIKPSDVGLEF